MTTTSHEAGFQVFTIESGDSIVELSEFGGQLLSWTKAGVPILFSNKGHAILDGKAPYRGGAPLCFPWFGKGTLLPHDENVPPTPGSLPLTLQHGPARTTIWGSELNESSLTFFTTIAGFACKLTYGFTNDLSLDIHIENTGCEAAVFQFVLHSYWACPDPASVHVTGLGTDYLDNLHGYAAFTDPCSDHPHPTPVDRVYTHPAANLGIVTDQSRIRIETKGFNSAVLWNPGTSHTIADLGEPAFLCVENGIITPAPTLAPAEQIRGGVTMSADTTFRVRDAIP